MPKPTKTQEKLLLMAYRSSQKMVAIQRYGGRGPEGGKVSGGDREANAAGKLRDLGWFERISSDNSRHTERGFTIFCYDSAWRLTEAGREVAAVIAKTPEA